MVRLTIDVDDALYARLEAAAERHDIRVDEYVLDAAAREAHESEVSDEFRELTREIIGEYRPVFDRLAQ